MLLHNLAFIIVRFGDYLERIELAGSTRIQDFEAPPFFVPVAGITV